MSFSYLKDHDNCMDVLLYIFCDSAFNVVKAFIRGTPPSLLCDNLKCELGGPAGYGGKCTPPENVGKIRKTRFLPFYKYYCYKKTRKRKKLLLTRKDVALVFFCPFQRLSTYCPREPLSMSHYTKVQHTSMCYHSHHPILLKTRKAISMAIPLQ